MGNEYEIDLNKYNCSCIQQEEGCFVDFLKDIKSSEDPFNLNTTSKKYSPKELQENTPGGIHYPNDNMVKSTSKKEPVKKFKLQLTDYNDSEFENSETTNIKKNIINTNDLNNSINTIEQKEIDIKEFDKNTNYFLLASQINKVINEFKTTLFSNDDNSLINKNIPTPTPKVSSNDGAKFEKKIKKIGKKGEKIIFNDIINCIKKLADINSEIVLMKEKIYLGIANKLKKEENNKYLINYKDEEKIVELPNFQDIKEKERAKLGDKFNNAKFKFNKFSIKGSFPNEILLWNLISKNTQRIANVLTENYYCCIVLLYYSQVEEEKETLMYLINKPT